MINSFFQTSAASNAPASKPNEAALAGILGGAIPEESKQPGIDLSAFPKDNDRTSMRDALRDETVTEATITQAARRVLYEMDRFGYLDGKQKHNITEQDIAANAAVIRKTAEDAAVLLKNEQGALPLKNADLQSLALIGPGAGQVDAIGTFGERSAGLTERQVGPFEALKKEAQRNGDRDAHITFAVDDDMTGVPIDGALLSHDGEPGVLRTEASGHISVDPQVNFTHTNGNSLPADGAQTWSGVLTVPSDGEYWLYLQVLGARGILKIDGKEIGRTGAAKGAVHGDIQYATQDNAFPTTDGLDNVRHSAHLTAGPHLIVLESTGDTSNQPEQIRLSWVTPEQRKRDHATAITTARNAHTAIVFLWTRGKPVFGLPREQDRLVEEIAAVNPNTIVVLNVSEPIALPWLSKVKAVLQMWWPGDEGGWATADVLLGKTNPAGRLPFTWAKRIEDYPATDLSHPERSAAGVDHKTTFSEGVDIGYRWYQANHVTPLFPFGYGLDYTNFTLSDPTVTTTANGVDVRVAATNVGRRSGDDVVQVYVRDPLNADEPPEQLRAFARVQLSPDQSSVVRLTIPWSQLQVFQHGAFTLVAGDYGIGIGQSSADIQYQSNVHATA